MDETTVRLPIRLVPRKSGQMLKFIFSLFGLVFALFWISQAWDMTSFVRAKDASFTGWGWFFPAVGLFIAASSFLAVIGTAAKLLPGSPFFHLALSVNGLALCSGLKMRRIDWADLSPFGVSVRTLHDDDTKKQHYWVVALRAKEADRLSNERDRYKRAVVRIDAGEYGEGNGGAASVVLADWLNEIRDAALSRSDSEFTVPPELRGAVIARGPVMRETKRPNRSGGVIER
jgi:hypothetical protein